MIFKFHHFLAAFIVSVSIILSGSVSAKDKVVVIPLMEEAPLTPDKIRRLCRSYEALGKTPPTTYDCPPKIVFVTHYKYGADFGGASFADYICWLEAQLSSELRGRQWKAWISESEYVCPLVTFIRSKTQYESVNGVKIADNFEDLIDGSLDSPIYRDQFNGFYYGNVWTGTNKDGTWIGNGHCEGWTSADSSAGGGYTGRPHQEYDNFRWTARFNNPCENGELPLLCFEQ